MKKLALALVLALGACASNGAPSPQVTQALQVACTVDGVVVPLTQPIVAATGPSGAAAAGADALLVHPAVVAACAALNGTPASAAPAPAKPAAS